LHVHETVTLDGTTSVFHRCRAKDCDCREFRPAAPAVRGAESEDAALVYSIGAAGSADDPTNRDVRVAASDGVFVRVSAGEQERLRALAARLSSRAAAPGEGAEDENALVAEVRGVILAALVCQQSYSADDLARALVRRGLRRAARSSSSPSTTGGET
jgi:hypothetical protein